MGTRRHGRELALQALFQLDFQPELSPEQALLLLFSSFGSEEDEESRGFAERLVRGVSGERDAIDHRITQASRNWRLDRMARVDRNLLRLAVFELCLGDVPPKVALNEAIELAKRYGAHETPAFVNGVLDRVLEALPSSKKGESSRSPSAG